MDSKIAELDILGDYQVEERWLKARHPTHKRYREVKS